jgi:hypothetical protein
MPSKWKTISSYGTARLLNFRAKAQELLHAIYAAGNLRMYQIADNKNPVFLSLYGSFDVKDNSIVSSLHSKRLLKLKGHSLMIMIFLIML